MHTNEAKTGQTLSANKDPAPPHPPQHIVTGLKWKSMLGKKKNQTNSLFLITQKFNFFVAKAKIQSTRVKIINKNKVLCIPVPTDHCLGRKQRNNKNKTMAVTAVTITCNRYTLQHWSVTSPFAKTPQKQTNNKRQKKKYKPQSDPPSSLPDPNTFLKYLSAHSKHLFCFLAEAGDINHTGGEGGKEGGRWSSRRGGGRGDFFF